MSNVTLNRDILCTNQNYLLKDTVQFRIFIEKKTTTVLSKIYDSFYRQINHKY